MCVWEEGWGGRRRNRGVEFQITRRGRWIAEIFESETLKSHLEKNRSEWFFGRLDNDQTNQRHFSRKRRERQTGFMVRYIIHECWKFCVPDPLCHQKSHPEVGIFRSDSWRNLINLAFIIQYGLYVRYTFISQVICC